MHNHIDTYIVIQIDMAGIEFNCTYSVIQIDMVDIDFAWRARPYMGG